MAVVDLTTFGANLYLLTGILVVLFFVVIPLALAMIVTLKWLRWRAVKKQADLEHDRKRFQPDGWHYPPLGRGLCDACHVADDEVFFLPSGQRLCHRCYPEPIDSPLPGQDTSVWKDPLESPSQGT
jgi:hypothetical protein